jgi:PPM family protein phosphatase
VIGHDTIEHASLTDVGIRRSHNQDAHAALLASDQEQWTVRGHIFLVADGMGAHAVGELASELAVGIIPHTFDKHAGQGTAPALRKAFVEANASIHARGQQNREFEGMGTTGTALLLRPEGAWVSHVGDSRAYRVRDGQIEQLSFLLWVYARQQRVDPETVQNIPSNVIVRSLGPEPLVQVDIEGPHPLQGGDIFLLCSDGLSGQVSDHEIGAVASTLPPEEACRFLVDLANLRGGPDNVTVTIVRVTDGSPADGPPPAPPGRVATWLAKVPWPLLALCLGVVLAGVAAFLGASQRPGILPTFGLAAVAILAGLAGLTLNYFREQHTPTSGPPEHRPLNIYRQAYCRIDRTLVDRIARAETTLHPMIQARGWSVDWAVNQKHRELAEGFVKQGDPPAAFREYCRALRPLTEAILQHRNKEDNYQGVWERTPG